MTAACRHFAAKRRGDVPLYVAACRSSTGLLRDRPFDASTLDTVGLGAYKVGKFEVNATSIRAVKDWWAPISVSRGSYISTSCATSSTATATSLSKVHRQNTCSARNSRRKAGRRVMISSVKDGRVSARPCRIIAAATGLVHQPPANKVRDPRVAKP